MGAMLSIPFRFAGNGSAALVDDNSPDGAMQLIGALICTQVGERVLVPSFGVQDPTWSDLDVSEVNAGLRVFGPAVTVKRLTAEWTSATQRRVVVEVDR